MWLIDDLKTVKSTDRAQYYYMLLFCAFWCNACFLDFGTVVVDKLLHVVNSRQIIKPVLFFYLTIKSWAYLRMRISNNNWAFFLVAGIVYLGNFVLFPENNEGLQKYLPYYFYALLFFFLGVSLDIKKGKDIIYYASVLNLLCSAFYNLIFTHAGGYSGSALDMNEVSHDMPQAYYVLPSVIYITWIALERFHIKDIFKLTVFSSVIFALLGFLLESSFGTRGPLVCIVLFAVIYVLLIKKTKRPWLYRTIVLMMGVVVYSFLNEFLLFMAGVTSSLGMSDRIFRLALEGTFTQGENSSDERWMIMNTIKNELSRNDFSSLWGHGFTGFWDKLGGYPHNVIYEILLTFGLVFGAIIIIYLLSLFIRAYTKNQNASVRGFFLVLLTCGFIKLLMSNTFLSEPFFFMLIGYCINVCSFKNRLISY